MAETEGSAILDAEDCRTLGLSSSPSASVADTSVAGPTTNEEEVSAASLHLHAELSGPTVSSRKKKKRKVNRTNTSTTAKKKSKATSERDLPTGVKKLKSGKLESSIWWGGKKRYIGTFDTAEQAAAARMSVKKDLPVTKLSGIGADEVGAIFDAAKKNVLESLGRVVREKRCQLPRGVCKTPSGKFRSQIKRGGKTRPIGTFDTPEQASAAYLSVRKDFDGANLPALSADEFNVAFDAAQKKALESCGGFVSKKRLPRGVRKVSTGKFESTIWCVCRKRYIGTFDTAEQASDAFMAIKKKLEDAKRSAVCADEVDAIFDAAKKKALESVGKVVREKRNLPKGVYKLPSGRFESLICRGGKHRTIGTFNTPEQASTAFLSVRKDLDDAKLSTLSADEVNAAFNTAKQKALEVVKAMMGSDKYGDECLV